MPDSGLFPARRRKERIFFMKKTVFIKNTVLMTGTSLVLRLLGILLKIWLAAGIGSEGIGLYHLIFSLYVLVANFAGIGLTTAVTRLCADRLARGDSAGALRTVHRGISLVLAAALLAFLLIFLPGDFWAAALLKDTRSALSLKICGFAFPFMGISAVLRGYFLARRKVTPNCLSQITEQTVRTVLCFGLLRRLSGFRVETSCACLFGADAAAEAAACLLLLFLYRGDQKRLPQSASSKTTGVFRELWRISLPITAGKYLTGVLRTVENVLVPRSLAHCIGYTEGLSFFGCVKGMALPVLFFPSGILGSVTALLIPELSEALAKKRPGIIRSSIRRVVLLTWLIGILCAGIFFFSGEKIGEILYRDARVGQLLRALAPLVPFMYLDSVCDGILKGMDQQNFTFRNSLLDSLVRIALILLLVPKYSVAGFLAVMVCSNLLTCGLCTLRLLKITETRPDFFKIILLPVLCCAAVCLFFWNMVSAIPSPLWCVLIFSLTAGTAYFLILLALRVFRMQDYL